MAAELKAHSSFWAKEEQHSFECAKAGSDYIVQYCIATSSAAKKSVDVLMETS